MMTKSWMIVESTLTVLSQCQVVIVFVFSVGVVVVCTGVMVGTMWGMGMFLCLLEACSVEGRRCGFGG